MKKILFLTLVLMSIQVAFTQCISMQPTSAILCPTTGALATVSVASDSVAASYSWQYRVVTTTVPNPTWITITSTNASGVYSNYNSFVFSYRYVV